MWNNHLRAKKGHFGRKTSICTFKIPTKGIHSATYYLENISKNLVLGVTSNGAVTEQILDLDDPGQTWAIEIPFVLMSCSMPDKSQLHSFIGFDWAYFNSAIFTNFSSVVDLEFFKSAISLDNS